MKRTANKSRKTVRVVLKKNRNLFQHSMQEVGLHGESQAVHMEDVRGELGQFPHHRARPQLSAVGSASSKSSGRPLRDEMKVDAVPFDHCIRVGGLNYAGPRAGVPGRPGEIHKRGKRIEQCVGRTPLRIEEATELDYMHAQRGESNS